MNIKIKCETCLKVMVVVRTPEIPPEVTSLNCNWCFSCEDEAEWYYQETYNYEEEDEPNPNQTNLF